MICIVLQDLGDVDVEAVIWAEVGPGAEVGSRARAAVREAMVQDGVGVAGLQNYAALAPLQALLQKRGVPFDLIVELFTQLSSGTSTDFNARTAEPERVRRQWEVARDCGAERIVAFAIDPWVLDDTPEAQLLRSQWKSAVG